MTEAQVRQMHRMAKSDVTANTILDLLRARHSDDVFVPECKDGPTQSASHSRMDAWVMKRSWRHPLVIAYEIKVTRNDFLRDEKWRAYTPCCNEFYFACAHGVAEPREMPEGVGLLIGSRNTRRLHCKKKAVYRDVQIPDSVYRYILMCRARVTREYAVEKGAYWREFLADKRDLGDMGHRVSRKLRAMINERIDKAERENKRLAGENEGLADVKRLCESLGVQVDSYSPEWEVRRQIEQLQAVLPEGIIEDARSAHSSLAAFLKAVDGEDGEDGG